MKVTFNLEVEDLFRDNYEDAIADFINELVKRHGKNMTFVSSIIESFGKENILSMMNDNDVANYLRSCGYKVE